MCMYIVHVCIHVQGPVYKMVKPMHTSCMYHRVYIRYAPTVSMLIPTSLNRGQVGELTTGNGNSPTTGCQLSPDSYLGEFTLDVNSPTLE